MAAKTLQEQIGQHIRNLRNQTGKSLEAVAGEVGITWKALLDWEQGKHKPRDKNLEKLAKALGVTVGEITHMSGATPQDIEAGITELVMLVGQHEQKLNRVIKKVSTGENKTKALEEKNLGLEKRVAALEAQLNKKSPGR